MLELKDVSIGYDRRYYVRGGNLEFHPGLIYGVVGRNGSGKTHLLRLCAGLSRPETGRVTLEGKDLSASTSARRRALIGYLPQHPGGHGWKKARRGCWDALADLKAVGLAALPEKRLSEGERNRLRLAGLLALDTPVLVLDDPLSGMDGVYSRWFLELLNRKKQGRTVILTLYDLNLARQYCDRLVVIDAGKELYTGTPEEIDRSGILKRVFPER